MAEVKVPTIFYPVSGKEVSYSISCEPQTKRERKPVFFTSYVGERITPPKWAFEPELSYVVSMTGPAFTSYKLWAAGVIEQPLGTPALSTLREREENWLQQHPEEIAKFAGQWVVIEGEKIVSHGRDFLAVVQQARDAGIKAPFVIRVPSKDEGPLIL